MTTENKKTVKTKVSKNDFKQEIIQKLTDALIHLKDLFGEKKFNSKVKKASKYFTHTAPKKTKVKKVIPVKVKKASPAADKKAKPVTKKAVAKPKTVKK